MSDRDSVDPLAGWFVANQKMRMDAHARRSRLVGLVMIVASVVLVASVIVTGRASAHDWYPFACCHDRDCREVPAGAIAPVPGGWRVPSGEVVPYGDKRVRITPSESGDTWHWCTQSGRTDTRTLCLFTPAMGS
jgi:hypothetical protein